MEKKKHPGHGSVQSSHLPRHARLRNRIQQSIQHEHDEGRSRARPCHAACHSARADSIAAFTAACTSFTEACATFITGDEVGRGCNRGQFTAVGIGAGLVLCVRSRVGPRPQNVCARRLHRCRHPTHQIWRYFEASWVVQIHAEAVASSGDQHQRGAAAAQCGARTPAAQCGARTPL